MSKLETITAAAAAAEGETVTAPLADLYLHPMNPRQDADPERVELLAQSILACGLIQNLGGIRDEDGKIGIVAGGRRLRALIIAAEQNPALAMVPVKIAPDALTAQAWANAENTAREAMTPAQEIRAYGKMRDTGASVTSIARAFAVPEKQVYRRLALADLPAPVLDALAADELSLGQAAAFTVADDETLALEVLERARGNGYFSEQQIKNALHPQAVRSTDRRARFVGIEGYEAAGGKITRDLFSEIVLFENADLLDRLFAEKLEDAATEAQTAGGWKWVDTSDESYLPWNYTDAHKLARIYGEEGELTEEEAEEYDELSDVDPDALEDEGKARLAELAAKTEPRFTAEQKVFAGCVVLVQNDGTFKSIEGLVKPEDQEAAVAAGILAPNRHPSGAVGNDQPKSPYSQKLVADMKALRLASVQGALLAKPELVLDLLAYALSNESDPYGGIFGLRSDPQVIEASETEGCEVDPRLLAAAQRNYGMDRADTADTFLAFQERGKKHRNAVLTTAIARLLSYGCNHGGHHNSTLFDHIEDEAKADLRAIWTPTAANFFGRVSGPYLEALFADFLSAEPTDERVRSFAKLKKAEKAETLEKLMTDPETRTLYGIEADQAERIAAWRPDCF